VAQSSPGQNLHISNSIFSFLFFSFSVGYIFVFPTVREAFVHLALVLIILHGVAIMDLHYEIHQYSISRN